MARGKFIVIEGSDGSGKTTQREELAKRLTEKEIKVMTIKFPNYESPTGGIVARYLGKEPFSQEFGASNEVDPMIASTWYALDRWAHKEEITSALENGTWVIADRYIESNLAHQGGKILSLLEEFRHFEKEGRLFIGRITPENLEEHSSVINRLYTAKRMQELGGFEGFVKWLTNLEYNQLKIPKADVVLYFYRTNKVGNELRDKRNEAADGHESSREHMLNTEQAYEKLATMFNWTRINCIHEGKMRSIQDISDEVWGHVGL